MNILDQHGERELDMLCECSKLHNGHLCVLRGKGLSSKIRDLSFTPDVVCERCNQEANSKNSVCIPVPLFI